MVNFEKKEGDFQYNFNPYLTNGKNYIIIEPTGVEKSIRGAFPVWEFRSISSLFKGLDVDLSYRLNKNITYKIERNIMIKNITDIIFGGLTFWIFGYAIIFGTNSNGFMSHQYFFTDKKDNYGWLFANFFFQFSFFHRAL